MFGVTFFVTDTTARPFADTTGPNLQLQCSQILLFQERRGEGRSEEERRGEER